MCFKFSSLGLLSLFKVDGHWNNSSESGAPSYSRKKKQFRIDFHSLMISFITKSVFFPFRRCDILLNNKILTSTSGWKLSNLSIPCIYRRPIVQPIASLKVTCIHFRCSHFIRSKRIAWFQFSERERDEKINKRLQRRKKGGQSDLRRFREQKRRN